MAFDLESIYRNVADGRLSKADALTLIREHKLRGGDAPNPAVSEAVVAPAARISTASQPLSPRPRLKLSDPIAQTANYLAPARVERRALAPLAQITPISSASNSEARGGVEIQDGGGGVIVMRVNPDDLPEMTVAMLANISQGFAELKTRSDAKVVVIVGGTHVFLGAESPTALGQAGQECVGAVRACELPVIAAMEGSAIGLGWQLGAVCDFLVCNAAARYGFTESQALDSMRREWGAFTRARFGAELAGKLLDETVPLTGAQLAEIGVSIPVVPADEVFGRAMELAQELARFPRESLALLKAHLNTNLRENSRRFPPLAPAPKANGGGTVWETDRALEIALAQAGNPAPCLGEGVAVPLSSEAARLVAYPDGVLVATLSDPDTKNAFSAAIAQGIQEIFAHVGSHSEYKVLVLTGYDRYFASGGTKEGLIAIHDGTTRYADAPLYELQPRCEIPVIAAMQGHAVGAGWAFGMFCDLAVLAEDGLYSSRFMRYGFTPGFGSTLIFEHRFGHDLGREILFAARDYSGSDLQRRGIRMPVVPSGEVLRMALQQAHQLASYSRQSLVAAKRSAAGWLLERLPAIVRAELAMHERTLVGNASALAGIEQHFDRPNPGPEACPQSPNPPSQAAAGVDSDRLRTLLRDSLAEELRLTAEEIEEDVPFTDLGLDSITGVSWVRRVNKLFALSLSANEVYHAPTLGEFTRLVRDRTARNGGENSAPPADNPTTARPATTGGQTSRTPEPSPEPIWSPLTEGQKGLWLLQRLDPEMAAYNVPIAFEIRDARWLEVFEETITLLVARHAMLGTVIAMDSRGEPSQCLPASSPIRVQRELVGGLSDEAFHLRLKAEFKKPFRLDRDALLRVSLFADSRGRQMALLVIHHIVFDGTSLSIFIRDLLEIWSLAARRVHAPDAPSLPVTAPVFFDFVRWEQAFLQSEEGAKELAYWKQQLTGEEITSEIPADRVRPPRRAYAGETVISRLPAALSERLRNLAKQKRVSLFTLLLGIYNVLLTRYTRQEAAVVGVPVSRRPDERFKEAIGYFVNMVAIKSTPTREKSFAEYLEQLKWTVLDGLDHSHYPFARLVSDLRIEPSPVRSPVFQTVFVLQNFLPREGFTGASNGELGVEILPGLHQEGEYDLRFEMIDQNSSLEMCVAYDASVYERETMVRLAQHYALLAESITDNPDAIIASYTLVSDAERLQIERAGNPPRREFGPDCCVHQVFEERVRQRPESVALIWEAGQWTYREIHERVTALAVSLQARGVRPEDRVLLCLSRSPGLVVSVLGVLLAGAAYVPVDPAYPADRLAFLLQDSSAKLVLTDSLALRRIEEANQGAVPVICIDRDEKRLRAEAKGQVIQREVMPSNLAYVIYTSGSTGKPKGVMVEHRQVLNTLCYLEAEFPLGEGDTYLLKTNATFDVSLAELFGWFFGAGRVAVLPAGDERLPDRIANAIRLWNVTHINFVPSALGVFLQAVPCAATTNPLNSLKYVMVAGEAFPRDMVAEAVRAFPGARVENIYGPTEAAIYASAYTCSPETIRTVNTPIGRPVPNTRLYVVDCWRQPVGVGVPGELCIAGVGVARGYLNHPELTAASFVEDPCEPGARMFVTGDLVRWLPDGQIEYFGRIDQQLKIRGFRVEPGEIESLLNQHPGIQASAVVAAGQGAGRQLAAYYVPQKNGVTLEEQALASYLGAALPDYMVPRIYVPVAAIPLTSSGKADRRALSLREIRRTAKDAATPPQGALEDRIAAIWKDLLKLESVGATDRFFEIGGNSLLAVMLADRLSREFQRGFPAAAVFKHCTIQAIASQLGVEAGEANRLPAPVKPEATIPCPSPDDYPAYYDDSVAIIGMSCCFPGANDLEQFWNLLSEGREGGRFLTPEELRQAGVPEAQIHDPKFVPLRLAIEDKEAFDADFFNIPARNALLMDPQFRQLLTHAWRAVEDGGYAPGKIPETSVFMSAGHSFYQRALDQSGIVEPADAYSSWVLGQGGTIPAMISFALGFTGPSLFVHTNCSSSLAGLHLACQSLRAGESKYALVGGASLFSVSRDGYLYRPGLNFSSDGRCKTFDASADGMVGGEGVAVILLKRAREALADGDAIYALVRGVTMNNDGPDKAGFYAPGVRGQAAVIDSVLRATRVDPESISYLEAHGTGTHLGDPVEVMALTDAYRRHTSRTQFCGLGSVKSNLGHPDTAAGLAGCIKLALSLHAATIVPTLHCHTPNPAIDFKASPFYVANKSTPWERKATPRRAALSSFGIGGSNVHAILEEAPAVPEASADGACGPFLVPLSAKNPERLREMIANLRKFLTTHETIPLADLAYTLAVGRKAMESRAVLLVQNSEDLLFKLESAQMEQGSGKVFWMGTAGEKAKDNLLGADDAQAMADKWRKEGKLDKWAQFWARGFDLDWTELFAGQTRRRVHLPTYPFAKDRYALDSAPVSDPVARLSPVAPRGANLLLGENASTLRELAFLTSLSGQEYFLADHIVQGHPLLPGVAYLEMARAAASKIAQAAEPGGIRLCDVVWLRPLQVEGELQTLRTVLTPAGSEKIQFEIRAEVTEGEAVVYCRGTAMVTNRPAPIALDLEVLRKSFPAASRAGSECYPVFANAGFQYGASFQAIREIWLGDGQALARMELPPPLAATRANYVLHPSILDAALQGCALIAMETITPAFGQVASTLLSGLPFAVQSVDIIRLCPASGWAWIRAVGRPNDRLRKFDIEVCDDQGNVCLQLRGYATRAVESPVLSTVSPVTLHYRPTWQSKPASPERQPSKDLRRVIWTCGVSALNLPTAACRHADGPQREDNLGPWFMDVAGRIFEDVRSALQKKSQGQILMQVAIPARGFESCLSALTGLFRTAHLENPRFFGQIIEVTPGTTPESMAACLNLEAGSPEVVRVRHTEGRRWVPVWSEVEASPVGERRPWKENGAYLITGGAGGLGVIFAREILSQTREAKVILVGRTKLSSSELEALNFPPGRTVYHAADLSRSDEVDGLIQRIQAVHPKLDGILHAAGIVQDNFILKKSVDEFKAVLAHKVLGTVYLERATRPLEPGFLALFSSGAGCFGSAGQADYATANAFLDGFAHLRQGDSGRTRILSIDWPWWQDGGMRVEEHKLVALRQAGMAAMQSGQGIEAFYKSLAADHAQCMPLVGDAERLRTLLTAPALAVQPKPTSSALAIDGKGLEARAGEYVRQIVADVAKRPWDKVALDTPFEKYGIDSILQIAIIEKLEKTTGELAKTLLFEYSTPGELAGYLAREHGDALRRVWGEIPTTPASVPAPSTEKSSPAVDMPEASQLALDAAAPERDDIAIIGLSGRYPLADSLEEFWNHLQAGHNCVTKADTRRWPQSLIPLVPKNGSPEYRREIYGGFLSEIDRFDHCLFGIAPERVMNMSPETRLFLETAWETFEDAGYARPALRRMQQNSSAGVGVFVGVMYHQYAWTVPSKDQGALGSNATEWHIPNQVSHFFDLTGPSMALNAACSSSLLAIHQACESLHQGSCSMALAGGVNLTLHPSKFEFLRAANLLEPGPASRGFGASAGYIPGEGVGAVLLKPLRAALRDGDRIYGVIKATYASHAGGRQVYTAPDPNQQTRLITECVKRAGIDPATIGYVESAVNGSPLGDPIEVLALKKAFRQFTQREAYCALGSVKSNLGHLEAASGISQLTKVLLQMKHRTLAPSIHSRPRNPAIQLHGSPFFIPEESAPWKPFSDQVTGKELPRRSLINSIGAGGTCVSLLVEEYVPRQSPQSSDVASVPMITLSSATQASLRSMARRLSAYLKQNSSLEISAVAGAMAVREPLAGFRAALVVQSLPEAIQKLDQLAQMNLKEEIPSIYFSELNGAGNDLPPLEAEGHSPTEIAAHWVAGGGLEFAASNLSRAAFPDLPKYAFDHSRSFAWIDPANKNDPRSPDETVVEKIMHGEMSESEFLEYLRL